MSLPFPSHLDLRAQTSQLASPYSGSGNSSSFSLPKTGTTRQTATFTSKTAQIVFNLQLQLFQAGTFTVVVWERAPGVIYQLDTAQKRRIFLPKILGVFLLISSQDVHLALNPFPVPQCKPGRVQRSGNKVLFEPPPPHLYFAQTDEHIHVRFLLPLCVKPEYFNKPSNVSNFSSNKRTKFSSTPDRCSKFGESHPTPRLNSRSTPLR